MSDKLDTTVKTLGERKIPSPLSLSTTYGDGIGNFVPNKAKTRFRAETGTLCDAPDIQFEKSGPREKIFFEPSKVRAAIVTCGGLCPGLNSVIRSAYMELSHNYGVTEILGLRYGYQGLNPAEGLPPMTLTEEKVDRIHYSGGTILGTSRGAQSVETMVDFLEKESINILLCVGGDGTQRGTHEIAEEILNRRLSIAAIGIPKTIDNDIQYVWRTFGYTTAIDKACEVLVGAHNEAKSAYNGVGLVKVMGRDSGFIACGATLTSQEANFCLIPEVLFTLEGRNGLLEALKGRILDRGHAVIVVAEGAGQELMPQGEADTDKSGNKLHQDIGPFLAGEIKRFFKEKSVRLNLKYIDPSYYIRSIPASSADSLLCDQYARDAVHAAMAGKTDMIVGYWNGRFMHVPIAMATSSRQKVEPEGEVWESVIASTGQPRIMR